MQVAFRTPIDDETSLLRAQSFVSSPKHSVLQENEHREHKVPAWYILAMLNMCATVLTPAFKGPTCEKLVDFVTVMDNIDPRFGFAASETKTRINIVHHCHKILYFLPNEQEYQEVLIQRLARLAFLIYLSIDE